MASTSGMEKEKGETGPLTNMYYFLSIFTGIHHQGRIE